MDPDPDPDPYPTLEHNKINWKGKLSKYAFWLGPGPTDQENQVKMYKKYRYRFR
jgi:hypothetical protein